MRSGCHNSFLLKSILSDSIILTLLLLVPFSKHVQLEWGGIHLLANLYFYKQNKPNSKQCWIIKCYLFGVLVEMAEEAVASPILRNWKRISLELCLTLPLDDSHTNLCKEKARACLWSSCLMHARVCTCICDVCMCLWRPKDDIRYWFSHATHLAFGGRVCHLA